jgi:predicted signal transduction protein with EAL and GGDEF domain
VVAEKIRQGSATIALGERPGRVQVGVSIGVVAWPDDGRTVDELMAAVDAAMYVSKRRGKNRPAGIDGRPPGATHGGDDRLPVPVPIAGGARPR